MLWFIKCLKHFADFNGRARRKEYWMFMLFNIIFSFIFTFIFTITCTIFSHKTYDATDITGLTYMLIIILALPSMSVTVRRLHDTGKSGWMLLISLIPVVGGILMLVKKLTIGQSEENKYGSNPKTTAEKFEEPDQLKSAGIVLIIAAVLSLCFLIANRIAFYKTPINFRYVFNFLSIIFLLISGIFLIKEKSIYNILHQFKIISLFFFFTALLSFIPRITSVKYFMPSMWNFKFKFYIIAIDNLINFLSVFAIFFFAALLLFLFMVKNKNIIHYASLAAIIFVCIQILYSIFQFRDHYSILANPWQYANHVYYIIRQVSYIVLTGTFLNRYVNPTEKVN